jgi:hypothetical protein
MLAAWVFAVFPCGPAVGNRDASRADLLPLLAEALHHDGDQQWYTLLVKSAPSQGNSPYAGTSCWPHNHGLAAGMHDELF